ncbi:MAG: malate synthase G [Propionibacteriaceae bacterium]|jgi:malate synthase|nr:malate synthase G [Propionibacteriaceae bacterium]
MSNLTVDDALAAFARNELLPGIGITESEFWGILADLQARFAPRIASLLARRDELQEALDEWHSHSEQPSVAEYEAFLTGIGYLEPVRQAQITVAGADAEITDISGPQLVVPATVPRYALNAANARWGSLFDALYGTDVLPRAGELAPGYDERRGAQVIAEVDRLLDELFPLAGASHAAVTAYVPGSVFTARTPGGDVPLADPSQYAGRSDKGVLLRRNGLHVEIVTDPGHVVGRSHHAGVCDVVMEAAITTIVDLEDSVACVDGEDKAAAYRTWLGLLTGDLSATFTKDGREITRTANPDREYLAPDGSRFTLHGRSLLLARTVGHHMRTDAVLVDSMPVAEGILDTLVCAAAALYDLRGLGKHANSRTGAVYFVKPKHHSPAEVELSVDIAAAVESALGMPRNTIKLGIMDEERRMSLNLESAIAAAKERVIFINTGFLDRTGDEIHSDFLAGPMVRKNDMKSSVWLNAYEDRNVDVGLASGFAGRAQVGKGMWAKPAAMADMVEQKIAHPQAGANCAWVPSPTAATLHALHYLRTDVPARQAELAGRATPRAKLLELPLLTARPTAEEIDAELRTNAQSILGYVVRWVGLGIGCSSVPDLSGVDLMEDRATLRISSQHIANWLHHGIVSEAQVRETFAQMAALVDEQQRDVANYPAMCPGLANSESFQAALELVFTGREEPNGYTERVLTKWRKAAKAR